MKCFTCCEGRVLKVGDLVNYYGHYSNNKKGMLCVVAYDYHGNLSMFFEEGRRHIIYKGCIDRIEYLGDNKELMTEELVWARHL